MLRFTILFLLCSQLSFSRADDSRNQNIDASDDAVAPVIQLTNAPADQWLKDPVLPRTQLKTSSASSNGTLLPDLSATFARPVTDSGKTGSLEQWRGLGRSVDDTNVESMGVPLNLPQGGGVDFTTLPFFLWSQASVVDGPSFGAYDGLASTGTLSLTPWSEQAIAGHADARFGGMMTNRDLRQYYAGARPTSDTAILAGFSDGRIHGVSGSGSAQGSFNERTHWRFDVLGTDVKVKDDGSVSFSTPNETLTTARVVPVIQADYRFNSKTLAQTEFYYNWATLRSINPDDASDDFFTRAAEYGNESILRSGDWKWSFNVKRRTFSTSAGVIAPTDTLGQTAWGYEWKKGSYTLAPAVSVNALSGMGAHAAGELGYRYQWNSTLALYMKGATSVKYPTMNDRYNDARFSGGAFAANQALQPERDWTAILGAESSFSGWKTSFEEFYQNRRNVILQKTLNTSPLLLTAENQGSAWVNSLTVRVQSPSFHGLRGETEVSWNHSHVEDQNSEFPYLSRWISVAKLRWMPLRDEEALQFASGFRTVSSFVAPPGTAELGGYSTFSFEARARVWSLGHHGLFAGLQFDNLLDRRYEAVRDYPSDGRTVAFQIGGEL